MTTLRSIMISCAVALVVCVHSAEAGPPETTATASGGLTTAPGTPAPGTPAPGTPAPGTPVPGTPAPGTPAPGTPAPCTPTPPPVSEKPDCSAYKVYVDNLKETVLRLSGKKRFFPLRRAKVLLEDLDLTVVAAKRCRESI